MLPDQILLVHFSKLRAKVQLLYIYEGVKTIKDKKTPHFLT